MRLWLFSWLKLGLLFIHFISILGNLQQHIESFSYCGCCAYVIKLLLIAHCPAAHSRFDPNAPPRFRVLSREQLGLAGGFIKAMHDYVFKTAQQSLTTANYSQQQ